MNEKSALDLERFVQQQHRSQQLLKQQQDMQGAEVTDCNFCNPDQVVETSCGVIAAFLHVKPGKLRRALQMSKGFQGLAGAAEYDVQLKEQAMGHYLLIAWSALLANMDASEKDRKMFVECMVRTTSMETALVMITSSLLGSCFCILELQLCA